MSYPIVTLKIDGQPILIDPNKFHESWLVRVVEYGTRRLINDTHSAEKGQVKFDLCMAEKLEMESGNPLVERARKAPSASKADAVQRLAREFATSFLTAKFRAAFKTDAMDVWAKNETAKKYLRFTDKGAARYDLAAIDTWIIAFAALPNGEDFAAKAREALAMSDESGDADLADLGL